MVNWFRRTRVDASGSYGGVFGDHNVVNQVWRAPVEGPVVVGNRPRPADCFQERPAEYDALCAALEGDPPGDGRTRTAVLIGLGGVGKSQLAARFRRRWLGGRGRDGLTLWVNATSRSTIVRAYADAWAAITGSETPLEDRETAAVALASWCSGPDRPWLIVIDDLNDPVDLEGLWPAGDAGVLLITTRRAESALLGPHHRRIDVAAFSERQSADYLVGKLGSRPRALDDPTGLADDLGHLPLALAQAAAFIADRDETCSGYRARFAERRGRLEDLFPRDALADDYPRSVAVTWWISIDAADDLAPKGVARPLLEIVAYFDPQGFPADLLTGPATRHYVEARLDDAADPFAPPPPLLDRRGCSDALAHLRRLSLVTVDDDPAAPRGVGVHTLVQRATREGTSDPAAASRTAAEALVSMWGDDGDQPLELTHAVHDSAATVVVHGEEGLWSPGAHPLLFKAGEAWGSSGQVALARDYFRRLAEVGSRRVGPDGLATLWARHRCAEMRGRAGDPAGAAAALEEVVADLVRVAGREHARTHEAQEDLAHWLGELGGEQETVQTLRELVTQESERYGPDHLSVLQLRLRLADWQGRASGPLQARAALSELLDDCQRVLGADHKTTLDVRQAQAMWQLGDVPVEVYDALVEDVRRRFGPSHPDTLTTLHNSATNRVNRGDPAGAAELFAELLTARLEVLGPEHPDTFENRVQLAMCRQQAGDADGVLEVVAVIEDQERVLGRDHPRTVGTRWALGLAQIRAGAVQDAALTWTEALEDSIRVTGADSIETLSSRYQLLLLHALNGTGDAGVDAYRTLVDDLERVVGPDHPQTVCARGDLAMAEAWAGLRVAALSDLATVVDAQRRLLGADHPSTQVTGAILMCWRMGMWSVLPDPRSVDGIMGQIGQGLGGWWG